jgi:hypothetical protein
MDVGVFTESLVLRDEHRGALPRSCDDDLIGGIAVKGLRFGIPLRPVENGSPTSRNTLPARPFPFAGWT